MIGFWQENVFSPMLLELFALAFWIAEFLAYFERRVAYYAARRFV